MNETVINSIFPSLLPVIAAENTNHPYANNLHNACNANNANDDVQLLRAGRLTSSTAWAARPFRIRSCSATAATRTLKATRSLPSASKLPSVSDGQAQIKPGTDRAGST
jgi:hypothetical protein